MAQRRPLVIVDGEVSELPLDDMLPGGALPESVNVQTFTRARNVTETLEWVKPVDCSMVAMILIGAGGNGGNGTADSGIEDGGGGGGSGGVTKLTLHAQFVADTLDVKFTAETAVAVTYPGADAVFAMANYGANGQDGDGTSGGPGGSEAAVPDQPQLSWWGSYQAQGGLAGGDGGSVLGAAPAVQQTQLVGPGSGGASGGVSVRHQSGDVKLGSTVIVAGGATETDGGDGVLYQGIYTGGSGGGAGDAENLTGQGGDGGDGGWYGCGGGGGGASDPSMSAGVGGVGGDAFVLIVSW